MGRAGAPIRTGGFRNAISTRRRVGPGGILCSNRASPTPGYRPVLILPHAIGRLVSAWRLLVLVPLLSAIGVAHPQELGGYPSSVEVADPREVALIPHYCVYTQIFRAKVPGADDKAVIDSWYERLGPGFHYLHHYCWGLMKTNRALLLATDAQTRLFYLRDSIAEFDFVIERVSDDFLLLPEILSKKGENLVRLGRGPEAVIFFQRAIDLKPDYWPPYAYMSDYYRQLGEQAKARAFLEEGLQRVPESQSLRARLAELDTSAKRKKGR